MIQKLLLLGLLIAAVWFGAKIYRRHEMSRQRDEEQDADRRRDGALVAQEMVMCPRCATYVAGPRPARCKRSDCPYPA